MSYQQVELILSRYDKLKAEKGLYDSLLQDIADYILPRRSNIVSRKSKGTKQTEKVYDSTAIFGCKRLAANMHGSLTSPASKWFSLRLRNNDMEDKEVEEWLETCAKLMYVVIRQSNLNAEIISVYQDLIALGTGAMNIEEAVRIGIRGFAGIECAAYEIGQYVIDEGSSGTVDTLFRCYQMSARNIIEMWPKTVHPKVTEAAKKDPDKPYDVLRAIFPKTEIKTKLDRRMPFLSVYILRDERHILGSKGLYEFPAVVPRWDKTGGEVYGRGLGHDALPDVKTLNKLVELTLKGLAKVVDPPVLAKHEGIVGSVKLVPGGITVVKDVETSIKSLETGTRWDVVTLKTEELKRGILSMFFNDQLQLQESPKMTAAEVGVRYEMMQRILGPTLGRLQSELLNPMIERIFGIMFRAGVFPRPPSQIMDMEFDIEYEGPLAKSQRAGEANAIEGFFGTCKAIAGEEDPEIMDILDKDKALKTIADIRGVPKSCIRDDKEIKKIRIARRQAIAEAQRAQDAAAGAAATEQLAAASKMTKETEMMGGPVE